MLNKKEGLTSEQQKKSWKRYSQKSKMMLFVSLRISIFDFSFLRELIFKHDFTLLHDKREILKYKNSLIPDQTNA